MAQPRKQQRSSACRTAWRKGTVRAEGTHNSSPTFEASATVERCLECFNSSNLDGLVQFLPDAVVDRCLQRKKDKL